MDVRVLKGRCVVVVAVSGMVTIWGGCLTNGLVACDTRLLSVLGDAVVVVVVVMVVVGLIVVANRRLTAKTINQ